LHQFIDGCYGLIIQPPHKKIIRYKLKRQAAKRTAFILQLA